MDDELIKFRETDISRSPSAQSSVSMNPAKFNNESEGSVNMLNNTTDGYIKKNSVSSGGRKKSASGGNLDRQRVSTLKGKGTFSVESIPVPKKFSYVSDEYMDRSFRQGRMSSNARHVLLQLMPEFRSNYSPTQSSLHEECDNVVNKNDVKDIRRSLRMNDVELADQTISTSKDDRDFIDHACQGRTYLFSIILRTLEELGGQHVPESKFYERKVALSIRPGDVPAGIDAKTFLAICLSFLCSDISRVLPHDVNACTKGKLSKETDSVSMVEPWNRQFLHSLFPKDLPLMILSEKDGMAVYSKNYSDSVSENVEFRNKIIRLERAFMSSCSSLRPRVETMPRFPSTQSKLEKYLVCCGTIAPPRSMPRRTSTSTKGSQGSQNTKKRKNAFALKTETGNKEATLNSEAPSPSNKTKPKELLNDEVEVQ